MSTEWTDKKHSLYLKSMEATFVKDLYNSFDLLSYQIESHVDPKVSRRKQTDSDASSGQFKVLQRGCWEKITFERNKSRSVKGEEPGLLLSNPWIQHFRSSARNQVVASSTLHDKVASAAEMSSCHSEEVTDQNFVDEEDVEENSNSKRIKIENSIDPTLINDQVVPLATFSGFKDDII